MREIDERLWPLQPRSRAPPDRARVAHRTVELAAARFAEDCKVPKRSRHTCAPHKHRHVARQLRLAAWPCRDERRLHAELEQTLRFRPAVVPRGQKEREAKGRGPAVRARVRATQRRIVPASISRMFLRMMPETSSFLSTFSRKLSEYLPQYLIGADAGRLDRSKQPGVVHCVVRRAPWVCVYECAKKHASQ